MHEWSSNYGEGDSGSCQREHAGCEVKFTGLGFLVTVYSEIYSSVTSFKCAVILAKHSQTPKMYYGKNTHSPGRQCC